MATLDLAKEYFVWLLELSLEELVKFRWDSTATNTKVEILVGEFKNTIVEHFGRRLEFHFIENAYFEKRVKKTREYAETLIGLELNSICVVGEYIELLVLKTFPTK